MLLGAGLALASAVMAAWLIDGKPRDETDHPAADDRTKNTSPSANAATVADA